MKIPQLRGPWECRQLLPSLQGEKEEWQDLDMSLPGRNPMQSPTTSHLQPPTPSDLHPARSLYVPISFYPGVVGPSVKVTALCGSDVVVKACLRGDRQHYKRR